MNVSNETYISPVHAYTELIRGTDGRLLNAVFPTYLPLAVKYKRAVGYFSSSVFEAAPKSFNEFFSRQGKIEVVCSPVFSEDDLEVLYQSLYIAPATQRIESEFDFDWSKKRIRHQVLAWAIRNNRMAIRIAVLANGRIGSIYHEKIGVLDLRDGRTITLEGSANESANAFSHNFERLLLYESRPGRWGDTIRNDFELLWANQTPGLRVISLHQAFVERLLQTRNPFDVEGSGTGRFEKRLKQMNVPNEILELPPRLELREYQQRAIDAWFDAGGQGVFSMATGSGKTITALATAESLYRHVGGPLVIIIVAPYLNLVDQWIDEARKFGLSPINCSGANASWVPIVETAIFLNQTGQRPILSLVTTNTTFSFEPFQRMLDRLAVRTLLIADEVHNLGARHLRRKLPERISLRLGLSATPTRWMDAEGSQAVEDYFGKTVLNFDLKDALAGPNAALCPYTYHPIMVALDDDETEEYMAITKQLARCMISPNPDNLSDLALALLLRRSRLVACAKGKLPAFARAFEPFRKTYYNLVYCGDGRTEIDVASPGISGQISEYDVIRQVDAVTRLLGHDFEMNVSKYTAETDLVHRRAILSDFERGDKQALVAIRCLDEGIDIPKVRRAFILASSTNPRQFIQRRGRVLRKAEGKEKAEIFDFVVVPPMEQVQPGTPEFKTLRSLVEREMQRVVEFAKLAINGPQAVGDLRHVLERLRLLHLL